MRQLLHFRQTEISDELYVATNQICYMQKKAENVTTIGTVTGAVAVGYPIDVILDTLKYTATSIPFIYTIEQQTTEILETQ